MLNDAVLLEVAQVACASARCAHEGKTADRVSYLFRLCLVGDGQGQLHPQRPAALGLLELPLGELVAQRLGQHLVALPGLHATGDRGVVVAGQRAQHRDLVEHPAAEILGRLEPAEAQDEPGVRAQPAACAARPTAPWRTSRARRTRSGAMETSDGGAGASKTRSAGVWSSTTSTSCSAHVARISRRRCSWTIAPVGVRAGRDEEDERRPGAAERPGEVVGPRAGVVAADGDDHGARTREQLHRARVGRGLDDDAVAAADERGRDELDRRPASRWSRRPGGPSSACRRPTAARRSRSAARGGPRGA